MGISTRGDLYTYIKDIDKVVRREVVYLVHVVVSAIVSPPSSSSVFFLLGSKFFSPASLRGVSALVLYMELPSNQQNTGTIECTYVHSKTIDCPSDKVGICSELMQSYQVGSQCRLGYVHVQEFRTVLNLI